MTDHKDMVEVTPLTNEEIVRVFGQFRNDLAEAHKEICKLQQLDPEKHSWPEWSSPANTLRWLDELEARLTAQAQGGDVEKRLNEKDLDND